MKKQFLAYVLDQLTPHGPITHRALFGGYGLYYEGLIFAVIVENELYFKVDGTNLAEFEQRGSRPFVYKGASKEVRMPYMLLPEEVLENRSELPSWIERSYQVALSSPKKKPARKAP